MPDNTDIDNRILSAIRDGYRSTGQVRYMACENFRVVDRRLQALRKAGKIAYSAKTGWAIVEGEEDGR